MTMLFGRRVIAEIGSLVIEGLDMRFNVTLDDKNFGKAELSIFNLNSEHRQEIEEGKDLSVSLSVGYLDQDLGLLFKGIVREAFSENTPPDWITTVRTGDGDKATRARSNRTYSPGSKFETMWKDATNDLKNQAGIGIGNAIEAFKKGEFKNGITQMFNGGTLQGSTLKELKRMAKSAKLDLTIQDGELLITEINQPLATTAVVLSPSTGLIGSPQKGAKNMVKIRALLIPGLKPKRKIVLDSRYISGNYVIKKANYKGDTSGNEWYAELQCEATT